MGVPLFAGMLVRRFCFVVDANLLMQIQHYSNGGGVVKTKMSLYRANVYQVPKQFGQVEAVSGGFEARLPLDSSLGTAPLYPSTGVRLQSARSGAVVIHGAYDLRL
jgi:hypothetical protein